jgi:hypothetical protein
VNQLRQAPADIRGGLAEVHRGERAFVLAATVRPAGSAYASSLPPK